jgi:hypothetical protein
MNLPFSIDEAILEIAGRSKLLFFGSTALFLYKKIPVRIYRILTSMNIASLGLMIPDLVFDNGMDSSCIYRSPDGRLFSFLINETDEKDPFLYLKKIRVNIMYDLAFSPLEKKYYSTDNDVGLSKKEFREVDVGGMNFEDILDTALIFGETGGELPVVRNGGGFPEFKFLPLRHFVELVLTSANPYGCLVFLNDANILEMIFPFLKKMKGVEQDRALHPEGDVFDHTVHCFRYVKNPSLKLAYGLLLHDYGKTIPSKRKGFSEHSTIGANFVYKILSQFGYPKKFIDDVQFLVKYHMINSYFFRLTSDERKALFDNGLGIELVKLFKADTLGSVGKLDKYQEIVSVLKRDKNIKAIR